MWYNINRGWTTICCENADDKYCVEDFFLNRLLFNVTAVEIRKIGGRAGYSDSAKLISFNRKFNTTYIINIDKKMICYHMYKC